jgi:hypothetical protein
LLRVKLKISYEAARRKISVLELWIDAIYKAYIDLRHRGDRKSAGALDESINSEKDILEGNTPSSRCRSIKENPAFRFVIGAGGLIYGLLKGFQKLRVLRMRLKLNRIKLKDFLEVKSNYTLNLSKVIPSEMKTLKLPFAYQYYDPVPIVLAVGLSKIRSI